MTQSTIALLIGGNTKRSRAGQHPVEIDWNALPDTSQDFIIRYGLKQYLADGMAGAENEADAKEGVNARVAKLKAGDLTRRAEAKERPNTVEGRALANIKAAIRAQLKAAGAKADKEQIEEAARLTLDSEAGEEWKTEAKAELAKEAKMAGKLDLTSLIAKVAGNAAEEDEEEYDYVETGDGKAPEDNDD